MSIKQKMILIFTVIVGFFAVHNNNSEKDYTFSHLDESPEYLYLQYGLLDMESGFLEVCSNPKMRDSLYKFLETVVGNSIIADAFLDAAEKYQIDPALIVALAWQESRFEVTAHGVNNNGTDDRGVMQLNSSSFPFLSVADFYDPRLNVDLGVSYLRKTLNLSGNTITALAMYNAGPGRVGSWGAPRSTLDYISNILNYRENLIKDYFDLNAVSISLISLRSGPIKDPDLL